MPMPVESNSLITAFEAGRLVNRLRFHIEQAWFGFLAPKQAAQEVLVRLGCIVRELAPVIDRRDYQEAVLRPIEELIDQIDSEGHHLAYDGWPLDFSDEELSDQSIRRELMPVFDAMAAVQRLIEGRLDDRTRLAFHLGELLDQGVCPRYVHRFLTRPRPDQELPEKPGIREQDNREIVLRLSQPNQSLKRANHNLDYPIYRAALPEDIGPDLGWNDNLSQLSSELERILGLAPEDLLGTSMSQMETFGQLVDQMAEKVEATLSALGENGSVHAAVQGADDRGHRQVSIEPEVKPKESTGAESSQPLTGDGKPSQHASNEAQESSETAKEWLTSRFKFDESKYIITYNGNDYKAKNPKYFKAFKRIYDASLNEKLISGMTLGIKNCHKRLKNNLPDELKSLVAGTPGPGGGYFLRRPQ